MEKLITNMNSHPWVYVFSSATSDNNKMHKETSGLELDFTEKG